MGTNYYVLCVFDAPADFDYSFMNAITSKNHQALFAPEKSNSKSTVESEQSPDQETEPLQSLA
jgi:hypothetical protein